MPRRFVAVMLAGVLIALALCWAGVTVWERWSAPERTGGGNVQDSAQLTPLGAAMELLRSGDSLAAEELVAAVVEEAARRHGTHSPQHAAASFDLATVRTAAGDAAGAVEAMREACRIEPKVAQDEKDRLTYQLNLGQLLRAAGQLDEAEQGLRSSLDERERLYGDDDPSYAQGLEALADALLARGKAEEALRLVDRAIRIYRAHEHERLASCLALRAHVVKAAGGPGTESFDSLDQLPGATLLALIEECARRGQSGDPALTLSVLRDLRAAMERSFGDQDPRLLVVLTHVANTARLAGDHQARLEAAEWVVQRWQQEGDEGEVVHALQGLGLAQSEAGQVEAAERSYRAAIEKASGLDDPRLSSVALRNAGLFLAEVARRTDAAELLQAAVEAGRRSGDDETCGRALTAWGVFLQHGGEPGGAQPPLEEALRLLPAAHPDALLARSHLEALATGGPCGCDLGRVIAEAVRQALHAELEAGLVEEVRVELVEGGPPQVAVATARKPSDAEAELMTRVVNRTVNEVLRRYRGAGL